MLTQTRQNSGQVMGRVPGMGVVVAQHPAQAGEGVLAELAGLLILPPHPQAEDEVVGRIQA
ncbi:MAG TPA: hypothetical protein VK887_10340 [Pseudonocardiaceae bacterium]|nr:hypothetical protein [Pseudonocardiaceae bacterium]